ncbi:RNA polymerase sigma factor [Paenibacillus sp. GYB003]|uniref:RNA polymerase sigma factor n=1 Tax=Paenibacillus sp. GYB003 TaxID=2994392 RepID=UPI002F9666CB
MNLDAERILWDEVRNGNKEAFRSLANPLIPKAYRTAYMMLRSKHLAEEAVQNALIELYSAIMSGKEISICAHGSASWSRSGRSISRGRSRATSITSHRRHGHSGRFAFAAGRFAAQGAVGAPARKALRRPSSSPSRFRSA